MTAIGVTKHSPGHDWKFRGERLVRASGLPYTIVRPGWFDYNEPDQQRLVMLQGDRRQPNVARARRRARPSADRPRPTVPRFEARSDRCTGRCSRLGEHANRPGAACRHRGSRIREAARVAGSGEPTGPPEDASRLRRETSPAESAHGRRRSEPPREHNPQRGFPTPDRRTRLLPIERWPNRRGYALAVSTRNCQLVRVSTPPNGSPVAYRKACARTV